jgi:hypothetical protein
MQLDFHPAPGLEGILPGWFVVPQNPIQPITYTPGIGDIVAATFPIPQNPVADYTRGQVKMIGQGVGCACDGGCSGKINGVGVGDVSSDWSAFTGNFGAALQDTIMGVPVWAAAAGVALLMLAGGEKHSYVGRTRRAARAAAGAFA